MPAKIQLVAETPLAIAADLLVVPVFLGAQADQEPVASLDKGVRGGLREMFGREGFKGEKDQQLDVPTPAGSAARRVILLGLGARERMTAADWRVYAARAARAANRLKAQSLTLALPRGFSGAVLRYLAEGVELGSYRFTKYMTGERRPKTELEQVSIPVGGKMAAGKVGNDAIELGQQVGRAVCLARDLINEPANELVPERLAAEAQRMAKANGIKCTVLDRSEIKKQGMKLLLAVGRGSRNEPRFVHMIYRPQRAKKKVVFVGKGLTFDSGGLCIKPASGMEEMKTDMAGAANVIGLLAACAAVKPNVEVHGIIAAAENMPDGAAYRPGDVFTSLAGKTVEIINTDAEGRLVLADALAYATKLEPDLLVDNATLTGACIVALGKTCSGFYATGDDIAARFDSASKEAGEQFWRLPLIEDLKDQLKSDIADLKHTGDRWGGSITAALFLREFVGKGAWIHADIAGPVWADRAAGCYPKGATGHGILTFLRLIERLG
jgi:leucyl aminopeptidase